MSRSYWRRVEDGQAQRSGGKRTPTSARERETHEQETKNMGSIGHIHAPRWLRVMCFSLVIGFWLLGAALADVYGSGSTDWLILVGVFLVGLVASACVYLLLMHWTVGEGERSAVGDKGSS
jgi:hypothetical protein